MASVSYRVHMHLDISIGRALIEFHLLAILALSLLLKLVLMLSEGICRDAILLHKVISLA